MHTPVRRAAWRSSAIAALALVTLAACAEPARRDADSPAEPVSLARGGGTPTVQRITVSPSSVALDPGQTRQLAATAYDRKGNALTGVTFTWQSSAASVATVSGAGLVTAVAPGNATISAIAGGKSGTASVLVNAPPPPPDAATLIAAGDIAGCTTDNDEATAKLVDGIPGTVAVLGDNAYENGSAADYANCYDPTWGRHKARTKPSVGNHEYQTAGASGYFGYFGAAAGDPAKGYYSYDLGTWHIIVLNSNCTIVSCAAGSAQEQWLRADLQANASKSCTLAYFHHPRFNSGASHGNTTAVAPFWDALYQFGADVILNGHEHIYERFAPQTPGAAADAARGIRQFTVGTGGRAFYSIGTIQPNSEVRNASTYGVLTLSLASGSYAWQFTPIAGQTFTDTGSTSCH